MRQIVDAKLPNLAEDLVEAAIFRFMPFEKKTACEKTIVI